MPEHLTPAFDPVFGSAFNSACDPVFNSACDPVFDPVCHSACDPVCHSAFNPPEAIAVLSMHTSPLTAPGSGDSGGLNVYVRELSAAMARAGTRVDIYVRRTDPNAPTHIEVVPGVRVTHINAGPADLTKESLPAVVDYYADRVAEHIAQRPVTALHAHYWLSGVAGHRLKHELDVPLAVTFHTLARVKSCNGDAEPDYRATAEQEVMDCADVVFTSCEAEAAQLSRHYEVESERIRILAPGVDLALFTPGQRHTAQTELGLARSTPLADPVLLFVGRLQPLKGAEIAVKALALTRTPAARNARLMIVGGPSGPDGASTLSELQRLVADLNLTRQVIFVPPQPHHLLPAYYRAADMCLVPSRSESFGLVALEAAACGIPVVASDVGGLSDNVTDGVTGLLVSDRSPERFAACIDRILDDPILALRLGSGGCVHAADHTWDASAGMAASVFLGLAARELVSCVGVGETKG